MAQVLAFPSAIGTFLFLAQFVAPLLLVAAAFVAFVRRLRRQRLLRAVVRAGRPDALNEIAWRDFALLVAESFRSQGFKVAESGDHADLKIRRGSETWLVECRQWRGTVGVDIVRDVHGQLLRAGTPRAYMVTSGTFSDDAIAFARDTEMRLVGAHELHEQLAMAAAR